MQSHIILRFAEFSANQQRVFSKNMGGNRIEQNAGSRKIRRSMNFEMVDPPTMKVLLEVLQLRIPMLRTFFLSRRLLAGLLITKNGVRMVG
jgi:hypothetical protein